LEEDNSPELVFGFEGKANYSKTG